MKIAFVNFIPPVSEKNYFAFHNGVAILSAVVKSVGHKTQLFNFSGENKDVNEQIQLSNYKPGVIFVYLTTNQYSLFVKFLSRGLLCPGIPLFAGGPHCMCLPRETAVLDGISGVCSSDGEPIILDIIDAVKNKKSVSDVPNMWFKKDNETVFSGNIKLVQDLDYLPFADRDIFPMEKFDSRSLDILGLEFFFSRGCNKKCSFCINPMLAKERGKYAVRRRSGKSAVDEIVQVINKYNYSRILGFTDDSFTMNKKWLEEFTFEYKKRVNLPFWCNCHIENIDTETIKLLRQAGCVRVQVGIESGDEDIRKNLLNKSINNKEILNAVKLLKKNHMKIVTMFMIGLPGETEDNILKSIDICRKIKPDWILLAVFSPYPGTAVYKELVSKKLLSKDYYKKLPPTYYTMDKTEYKWRLPVSKLSYYYKNFIKLCGE